jgi:hypothetical protein
MSESTLKSRYDKLAAEDRTIFLNRAQLCSKLTIPSLIPEDGTTSATSFYTPWQSIGAKGVNNLASKILLALFQPGSPYFRLTVNEADLAELGEATVGEVEAGLATYERVVMSSLENSKSRSSLFNALKHLLVGGNSLLFEDPKTGTVRMYPLSRFVVKRTPGGKHVQIITMDTTSWGVLDDDTKAAVLNSPHPGAERGADDKVEIYTGIALIDKKWMIYQEVAGVMVPGSEATYPMDACPYIPLRFSAVEGEDYGRGMIEELYGDLNTVDALQQAVAEGSSIASLVKFLVDPNGNTEVSDLTKTPNGGFCPGRARDVEALQVQKYGDLRVAREYLAELKADLQAAFLMHQSVQRNAERVTAEEIRFMAQELEDALGGIYSLLAQELQLPLVNSSIRRLTKNKTLPPLPKEIKPEIITGLAALGRNQEHQRLRVFVADVAQTFGPEVSAKYISVDEYAARSGAALNIQTEGLVRTTEEVDQRDQQALEQQAAAQAQAQGQPTE